MKRWQYEIVQLRGMATPMERTTEACRLDEFGAQGWELVSIVAWPSGACTAFLKREVEA